MATVTGPSISALALDERASLLVSCETAPGSSTTLSIERGINRVLGSRKKPAYAGAPAVVCENGSSPVIVVQGRGEQLIALGGFSNTGIPRALWRIKGRSQSTGWPDCRYGPVMADLNGDGHRQVIYAAEAPSGCARLVVSDMACRELWHHDFPHIPGDPAPWNIGGLILWQVGRFTEKDRMDVMVTIRRSMMHSEETLLLSGRDGQKIWHRKRQILQRGVGGTPFAISDCDSDGLDDVVSLHPNVYYILDGVTGENMIGKEVEYWGLPIAGDFLNDNTKSIFFATERASLTAVLKTDGTLVWSDALGESAKHPPAFGNFTGRLRMEAIGVGYPDGIRCYDAATGHINWILPLPYEGPVAGTAAADIDSDGYDEALIVVGNTIYCVGSGKDDKMGKLEWKLSLPCPLGPPAIADINNDSFAEIIISGNDGYVYCVTGK
jgi:hypothetical protein